MTDYDRLRAAIGRRRSIRTYSGQPLSAVQMDKLRQVQADLQASCPAARAWLIDQIEEPVFTGIIGSLGAVVGAASGIVLIGDTAHPNCYETAGYLGEALVLEATALGLGTCWISGFYRPSVLRGKISLRPTERFLAIIAVGLAGDGPRWDEKLMKAVVGSTRRKSLSQICSSDIDQLPPWAIAGLEAARLAPSARNRQPWRFVASQADVQLQVDGRATRGKRFDCGIASYHFVVGAGSAGEAVRCQFGQGPVVATFTPAQLDHAGKT